ncbi:9134_t:CDS:2 [Entrophospora sp. SA101]|nr:9134_t:CDS:2 [Entrophospora sp. SA101]
MFDGKVKNFIDSLQTSADTIKTNKSNLETWTSDSDYQKFLTLDDKTQQTNIGLVQDIIKVATEAVQDSLQNILNYAKETFKFCEEMIENLEKTIGSDAGIAAQKAQLALQKSSVVLCESKLTGFKQQGISEQIKTIREDEVGFFSTTQGYYVLHKHKGESFPKEIKGLTECYAKKIDEIEDEVLKEKRELEALEKRYNQSNKNPGQREAEIQQLRTRIAELENIANRTPEQEQELQDKKKELEKLEKETKSSSSDF